MKCIVEIRIGDSIWTIHINEDSLKRGCNFLANEIWVNGSWQEAGAELTKGLMIARKIEYGERWRESGDLNDTVNRIMRATGLKI